MQLNLSSPSLPGWARKAEHSLLGNQKLEAGHTTWASVCVLLYKPGVLLGEQATHKWCSS